MPVTLLSHQALVIPLKMKWPHRFSGVALCIGSMVPDLEFIGRMRDDWEFSHTLFAQLWFTLPTTMALVWLSTALVMPRLLPYLRDHPAWRLHDLAALKPPRTARDWTSVATSAWIGGMSHIILDGITHGNHSGWLVPWLPFLRQAVPHIGGPVPLHDALQFWLTIVLAFATARMWRVIAQRRLLWHWRDRDVASLPRMSRNAGLQLITVCLASAVIGALLGRQLHAGEGSKALAAGIAFGAIDFTGITLVFAALSVQHRRRVTIPVSTTSVSLTSNPG